MAGVLIGKGNTEEKDRCGWDGDIESKSTKKGIP